MTKTNTAAVGVLPRSTQSVAAFTKPIEYRPNPRPLSTSVIRLVATETQIDIAASVALARCLYHDKRGRRADQDLGNRNQSIDYVGALAEVLIRQALDAQGIPYEASRFFDSAIPVGPDLTIDGVTFNVKAIPRSQAFLMLNEEQRLDPRKASDYILPLRFTSPTTAAVAAPVPACEIDDWLLREGHSPYRSIAVSRLSRLGSLQQLQGGCL